MAKIGPTCGDGGPVPRSVYRLAITTPRLTVDLFDAPGWLDAHRGAYGELDRRCSLLTASEDQPATTNVCG